MTSPLSAPVIKASQDSRINHSAFLRSAQSLADTTRAIFIASAASGPIDQHAHRCDFSGKAERPPNILNDSEQLLSAINDAPQCRAVARARLLHRDASNGNVLTDEIGNRLLADREVCVHVGQQSESHRKGRIGTPRFMATRLLENLGHLCATRDDLESFVYLAWYYVIRYCHVSNSPKYIVSMLRLLFDGAWETFCNHATAGENKMMLLMARPFDRELATVPYAVRRLLKTLCMLFTPLYIMRPIDEEDGELEQWQKSYRDAKQSLQTHVEIIRTFGKYLDMDDAKWSPSVAASDIYLRVHPKLRQATDNGELPERGYSSTSK